MAAKEDQWSDESRIPHLPNDVLMASLSRLPIKTLMAIECVSKSWLNLISRDTHFTKMYHHRSPTELLLRSPTSRSDQLYLGKLQFQNNTVSGIELTLLFDLHRCIVRRENRDLPPHFLVNYCNGLVCFRTLNDHTNSHCAVICNPVTGEFITVPGAELNDVIVQCLGLGFSRKENRYKLLRSMSRKEVDDQSPKAFAEICTFEKGSLWRDSTDCPFQLHEILFRNSSVFFEGKLHFHCTREREGYIDCFDFDNEQFGRVSLPPSCDRGYISSMTLIGVFGGNLSVSRFRSSYCMEMWVMKEYGVKDSWTKTFSVNHCLPQLCPSVYLGSDEVLMFRGDLTRTLELYNSVLNTSRSLGSFPSFVMEVIPYTPTFLRLKDALAGYEDCVKNVNSW